MPTVLIVDDDAALRGAVATALTDLGHEAAQAENGEAALAWLSRHRADAVLLDLRMPGMDGMDVLRRIRAREDAPPIAVLTAVPTSENTIEAMRLGAADHLAKPIGRDGLRALMERMLPRADMATPIVQFVSARGDDLIGMSSAMREVTSIGVRLEPAERTALTPCVANNGRPNFRISLARFGENTPPGFVLDVRPGSAQLVCAAFGLVTESL